MVLWKTTVVLVAGLTGSGIVAVTRSGESPQRVAYTQQAALPGNLSNDSFDQGYVHARFAAQRPFATFSRVSR